MPQALRPARLNAPQLKFQVEQRHIDEAIRGDSGHCMIAEAIRDAYPGAQRVLVDLQSIRFTVPKRGLRFLYWTPKVAQQALVDFDQGRRDRLKPFRISTGRAFQIMRLTVSPNRAAKIRGQVKRGEELTEVDRDALERDRARHRRPRVQEGKRGHSPVMLDGQPPPRVVTIARRREFGVKALRP